MIKNFKKKNERPCHTHTYLQNESINYSVNDLGSLLKQIHIV